jgi:transcriptional regulator with XRE-family HTH domain
MEDLHLGAWIRAERRRRRMRQSDLARVAGVSDQTVVRVEHGRVGDMTLGRVRSVAAGVGIRVVLTARSVRGPDLERQVDRRHAALVEAVTAILGEIGWEVDLEWSFSHYGERGSVDVLAWHAGSATLLVVEAKSELVDLQETLRALDVKRRLVPDLAAKQSGLRARTVGVVLAVADERVERARVQRHSATFQAALPARTVEVKHWIRRPYGNLRGLWFLPIPRTASASRSRGGPRRVRVSPPGRHEGADERGQGRGESARSRSPRDNPGQSMQHVDSATIAG